MSEFSLEKRYEIFLGMLIKELNRMFSAQSEFIKCKEGCSYCCEKGEYPFSRIEFDYLMKGYKALPQGTKNKILENIANINEDKKKSDNKDFMYKCPFLLDKRCTVYENRGIICRTFGLLCEHTDDRYTIPFCHEYGLNYSNVYDKELGQISEELSQSYETEPTAYRISRETIQNLSIAKNLNIEWGESKTLIDFINESDDLETMP